MKRRQFNYVVLHLTPSKSSFDWEADRQIPIYTFERIAVSDRSGWSQYYRRICRSFVRKYTCEMRNNLSTATGHRQVLVFRKLGLNFVLKNLSECFPVNRAQTLWLKRNQQVF